MGEWEGEVSTKERRKASEDRKEGLLSHRELACAVSIFLSLSLSLTPHLVGTVFLSCLVCKCLRLCVCVCMGPVFKSPTVSKDESKYGRALLACGDGDACVPAWMTEAWLP